MIQFEKCDPTLRSTCKDEDEILRWLRRKFILTYTNQRRFRIQNYDEKKVVEEARTNWIPINSQLREEIVFKMEITELTLEDERVWLSFGLGQQPDNETFMFKFVEAPTRPYEFENNVHISITFEMDLNLKQIDRQVYNLLDLIGDIGGLGEGLFFMTYTLLSVIHFGALDNQII